MSASAQITQVMCSKYVVSSLVGVTLNSLGQGVELVSKGYIYSLYWFGSH